MTKLSIIIPVWKDEDTIALIASLKPLNAHEVIVTTKGSRARVMNSAASKATGDVLWFLHADSIVSNKAMDKVKNILKKPLVGLHYFDLKFSEPSLLMKLNAVGVYLRCRLFRLPFGDQGFIINKNTFLKIGAYDETVKYGEDHVLVWQAKRNNVSILPIGASISTSARKYLKNGWLKTTIKHQFMFYKQVYSQIKIKR